jgi:uncharacterized phage protein (TIGR01671 family)
MREIKFRAWDDINKYMIDSSYGDWISFNGVPYTDSVRKYDTPNTEIEKAVGYILEQFTGLKDNREVDIYEGDIIEHSDATWRAEVKWCESGKWILHYTGIGREVLLSDRTDYIIVIGNIHQNPELI